MRYLLAADTGGTFTDLAAFDRERGGIIYTKSLTTYGDLVEGLMNCLHKAGIDLRQAEMVKFGTTLVINTFVQRSGARTALVTTRGHRDVLEIRRGNRTDPFDLRYERDPVLVERDLRLEVNERIAGDGSVVRPLDSEELELVAATLDRMEIQAVAVSFLNAYANPVHEEAAAALLRGRLPGVYVTAGTGLSREWYEYERTSTAVANAYVGPRLDDYLSRLDATMRGEGFAKSFFMMASNGGVFSVERAREQPVALVESGPVGGCIGAGVYAVELGLPRVVAFDMGGTTAKCALIENGRFEVKSPYYVGGEARGFPVRHAVLDIVEVGAGGGSIAWLDEQQRLSVGPRSAGSDPGPVAYGRGGAEPTITDANLAMGRIGADSFLGGEMRLDANAAREAIERIGRPLGFSGAAGLDEMAHGIIALGTMTMAGAIRQITTERGLDPRDFVLFAFGGGGPLHAATLAREMHIPEVVIPPEPGVFSALGMLLADGRVDETQTFLRPLDEESMEEMEARFSSMEAAIGGSLSRELGPVELRFERQAQMRFRGQRHVVKAPIDKGAGVARARAEFEEVYRRRYGFVEPGAPLEIVNLVVSALARFERPQLDRLRPEAPAQVQAPAESRPVYFAERSGRLETPVYRRYALRPGFTATGPAIIEEYGSTTVVGPDDRFEIGRLGEIRIRFDYS